MYSSHPPTSHTETRLTYCTSRLLSSLSGSTLNTPSLPYSMSRLIHTFPTPFSPYISTPLPFVDLPFPSISTLSYPVLLPTDSQIEKVVQTCKDLLSDASIQVSKLEIGVIAAFRSQVRTCH